VLPADGGNPLTVEALRRGEPKVLAELVEQ